MSSSPTVIKKQKLGNKCPKCISGALMVDNGDVQLFCINCGYRLHGVTMLDRYDLMVRDQGIKKIRQSTAKTYREIERDYNLGLTWQRIQQICRR